MIQPNSHSARVSGTFSEGEIKRMKPMDIFKGAQLSDSKIDQSFLFLSSTLQKKGYPNIFWLSQIVHCPVVRGTKETYQTEYWWGGWEGSDSSDWLIAFHKSCGFQSLIFNKTEGLDQVVRGSLNFHKK